MYVAGTMDWMDFSELLWSVGSWVRLSTLICVCVHTTRFGSGLRLGEYLGRVLLALQTAFRIPLHIAWPTWGTRASYDRLIPTFLWWCTVGAALANEVFQHHRVRFGCTLQGVPIQEYGLRVGLCVGWHFSIGSSHLEVWRYNQLPNKSCSMRQWWVDNYGVDYIMII